MEKSDNKGKSLLTFVIFLRMIKIMKIKTVKVIFISHDVGIRMIVLIQINAVTVIMTVVIQITMAVSRPKKHGKSSNSNEDDKKL